MARDDEREGEEACEREREHFGGGKTKENCGGFNGRGKDGSEEESGHEHEREHEHGLEQGEGENECELQSEDGKLSTRTSTPVLLIYRSFQRSGKPKYKTETMLQIQRQTWNKDGNIMKRVEHDFKALAIMGYDCYCIR